MFVQTSQAGRQRYSDTSTNEISEYYLAEFNWVTRFDVSSSNIDLKSNILFEKIEQISRFCLPVISLYHAFAAVRWMIKKTPKLESSTHAKYECKL